MEIRLLMDFHNETFYEMYFKKKEIEPKSTQSEEGKMKKDILNMWETPQKYEAYKIIMISFKQEFKYRNINDNKMED